MPTEVLPSTQIEIITRQLEIKGISTETKIINSSNPFFGLIQLILLDCRKHDRKASICMTGSGNHPDKMNLSIGCINSREDIIHDPNSPSQSILKQKVLNDRPLFGGVSDLDLLILSNTLTPENLSEIMQKQLSQEPYFNRLPMKIEVLRYRPREILQYLQESPTDYEGHNDVVGRIGLTLKGVVDLISKKEFTEITNLCLLQLFQEQKKAAEKPIEENWTVQSIIGYYEFLLIKHLSRLNIHLPQELINLSIFQLRYLSLNSKGSQKNDPWLSIPPHKNPDLESFKLVYPQHESKSPYAINTDNPVNLVQETEKNTPYDLLITPPLTAYTPGIHIGQFVTTLYATALSRLTNSEYNPLQFQTQGKYWSDKGITDPLEISLQINNNIQKITTKLREYGITSETSTKDTDQISERAISRLLKLWADLNMIFVRDKKLYLRKGSALTFFGSVESARGSKRLLELVRTEIEKNRLLLIKDDDQTNFPFYLTSMVLPYATKIQDKLPRVGKITILSGQNILNEFALPHVITSHTTAANKPDITIHEINLITDSKGQRMSRKLGNVLYLGDIEKSVQELIENGLSEEHPLFSKHKNRLDKIKNGAIIYGIIGHVSNQETRKLDETLFKEGLIFITNLLDFIEIQTLKQDTRNQYKTVKTPDIFSRLLIKNPLEALRFFRKQLSEAKNNSINSEKTDEIMKMTEILFGKILFD